MCKQIMATGDANKVIAVSKIKDIKLVYRCSRFSVYEMSNVALQKLYEAADRFEGDKETKYKFVEATGYVFEGIWDIGNFNVADDTMIGYIPDDNFTGTIKEDGDIDITQGYYTKKKYKDFFDYAEEVLGEKDDNCIYAAAVALAKKNKMKVGAFLTRFAPTNL